MPRTQEDLTIKDLLEQVYDLIQLRLEVIGDKEYPGKEIDTSYFKGMDDGLREVFGRMHLYKILDLPLSIAQAIAKGDYRVVEE